MTSEVTVRWLGTNAWQITTETATILVDPWVSRFGSTKDGEFDPETPLSVDDEAVDEYFPDADTILITHSHYDHIGDTPRIATRTGATVLGTETHLNLLRALDTPSEQLAQVAGGELYRFDGFTVEVFASSHNATGKHKTILFGGTMPRVPRRPTKVKHLLEGGSLSYLIDFGDTSLFFNATPSFHERALAGIRPTVLFMQGAHPNYPRYEERMFAATGYPPYVVPTHWDDFELPLTEPAVDEYGAAKLRERVAEVSPDTTFIQLDHLESHTF